nr:tripartite tricarboxylate transporter permease [Fusibacter ferrireducens]
MSAALGLTVSMIGLDPLIGTPRLSLGLYDLQAGVATVPALVGLFGLSEVLTVIYEHNFNQVVMQMKKMKMSIKEVLKHWKMGIYGSFLGSLIGALPGAGGPVAAFISYNEAKRLIQSPSVPFGEGAVEGIVASESSNNACIGGALIPMLTLAVPGDAVTAILLSVFYVHGLKPGPMFIRENPEMFYTIVISGLVACVALLLLGLLVAPRISKLISIPKNILLPMVSVLCFIGAFAGNNRIFDVVLMLIFGIIGFAMRQRDYPVAPMVLAIVLGGMMDSNFRRAVSLALPKEHVVLSMINRPITLVLLVLTLLMIISNMPFIKRKVKQ